MTAKVRILSSMRFRENIDPSKPFTYSHAGACPKCELMVPPLPVARDEYFANGKTRCDDCQAKVDPWETSVAFLRRMAEPDWGLQVLGNKQTIGHFDLQANQTRQVDFTHWGVASDAVIFHVTWSSSGDGNGCVPAEMDWPPGKARGSTRTVYGVPIGTGTSTTKVTALVTWVERGEDTAARSYLLDAFTTSLEDRWTHAIVPALASVEIALVPQVLDLLAKCSSRSAVKDAKRDLSFSLVLNVILPTLCDLTDTRKLPAKIRGQLNRLRKDRNHFAHDGIVRFDRKDLNQFLCAAFFGQEYAAFLRDSLPV